jgi:hypothetical protein
MHTKDKASYRLLQDMDSRKTIALLSSAAKQAAGDSYLSSCNEGKNEFHNWKMPKQPTGFLKYKERDPL